MERYDSSYRYQLDKSSKKYFCPQCRQKRFVRYVDTISGGYVNEAVGRCDRQDSCGYHYPPRDYFRDHNILPDKQTFKYNHNKHNTKMERKTASFLDYGNVEKYRSNNSSFGRFIERTFSAYPNVSDVLDAYRIGSMEDGSVIFWQIDYDGGLRTGKVMRYNESTGKRIKESNAATRITWMHKVINVKEDWNLSQCLFGEHLLKIRPEAKVCIVEAEKTAVIASIVFPDYVWLATGGKANFKADRMSRLRERDIILYPDLGAFEDWLRKMNDVALTVSCRFSVSRLLEDNATDDERKAGLDIADYIINQINEDGIQHK